MFAPNKLPHRFRFGYLLSQVVGPTLRIEGVIRPAASDSSPLQRRKTGPRERGQHDDREVERTEDERLHRWFNPDEIDTIADAAEDHRASSGHEPRTIYGRLVAEADRVIDGETIVRRALQYGMKHEPGLDREGQYRRLMEHMREKYDYGGYLKLWIPHGDNARRLEEFRQLLADPKAFLRLFDKIYNSLIH